MVPLLPLKVVVNLILFIYCEANIIDSNARERDWKRESLNSLDLRNGGVALYLENFSRLNCTLAVLFSALKIDSSLLPSLVPSLK